VAALNLALLITGAFAPGLAKGLFMNGTRDQDGRPAAGPPLRRRPRQETPRPRTVRFDLTEAEFAELEQAASRAGPAQRRPVPRGLTPRSTEGPLCPLFGDQLLVHLKGVALDLIGQQHSIFPHGPDCDPGYLDGLTVGLGTKGAVVCTG
jgi:hypothetical protein